MRLLFSNLLKCGITVILFVCSYILLNVSFDVFASEMDSFTSARAYIEDMYPEKNVEIIEEHKELNSLLIDNNDGTKTLLIFNQNIRYEDETGNIREKDLSLVTPEDKSKLKSGYILEVKSNEVDSSFPININKGIMLNDVNIVLKNTNATVSEIEDSYALYKNVYDGIDISYNAQLEGVSGNIFAENAESLTNIKVAFDSLNGADYYEDEGSIIVDYGSNEVYKLTGSSIFNESNEYVGESYFTLNDDNTASMNYNLSAEVDSINLVTELSVLHTALGGSEISTTTVYNNANQETPSGDYIGTHDEYGIARMFYKIDLSSLSGITYDNILNAAIVTGATCTDRAYGEIYMVSEEWNENTISWDNMPECNMQSCLFKMDLQDDMVSSLGEKNRIFYITPAVQAWMQGLNNNGLMLKASNDKGWAELKREIENGFPLTMFVTYSENSDTPITKGIESHEWYYFINKMNGCAMGYNEEGYGEKPITSDFSMSSEEGYFLRSAFVENGIEYYYIQDTVNFYFLSYDLTNNSVYQNGYSNTDDCIWRIVRNWDGSYKIIPKSSNGSKALSYGIDNASGKEIVTLVEATIDFNKNDDWTLIPVDKGKATLYGGCGVCSTIKGTTELTFFSEFVTCNEYPVDKKSTCSVLDLELPILTNPDDSSSYSEKANIYRAKLFESDIWYFYNHGVSSRMEFNDWVNYNSSVMTKLSMIGPIDKIDSNIDDDIFTTANVYGISDYEGDLNKLRLAIIHACSSGGMYEANSLVGTMYEEGAHCIISHTEDLQVNESEYWYKYFNIALSVSNVKNAMEFADRCLYFYTSRSGDGYATARNVLGDTSVFYNYEANTNGQELVFEVDRTISFRNKQVELSKISTVTDRKIGSPEITAVENSEDFDRPYMDIYLGKDRNLYGISIDTGRMLLYSYNQNYDTLGNNLVDATNAITCASTFITDLGYNPSDYDVVHSNEYSNEFILKYTLKDNVVNDISEIYVFIEEDVNNIPYVTFFNARGEREGV